MLFADIPPTSVVLRHPKKDKVRINIERNIRISISTDNDLIIYTGNQSNPPNTTHHAAMAHLKSKEVSNLAIWDLKSSAHLLDHIGPVEINWLCSLARQ